MVKETVGKIATDLMKKEDHGMVPVIEQAQAMKSQFMDNLFEAVDRGCTKYPGNFFIEVNEKNERLLPKVHRDYFVDVLSCPAPTYDHSVFRYNREKGQIEYLWTVPRKDVADMMRENADEILKQPAWTGEVELLRFLYMFDNGVLFKMMKQYNKEKLETPELII
jgi:hypothetical protein